MTTAGNQSRQRRKTGRLLPRWLSAVAAAGLVVAVLFGAGFLWFVSTLGDAAAPPPKAEGIVVLTGGQNRIAVGIDLLKNQRGRRLLISGVHPEVTLEELAASAGVDIAPFRCCIELDQVAENTVGNAEETAAWAHRNKFTSLIVVTAAYHMPRSLAELERTLPDVRLIPHPVFPEKVHLERWWAYPGTTRLLASEYGKYLVTLLRISASQNA